MPIINLETRIKASPEKVFNLARSVNLHLESMNRYHEKVLEGRKEGLFEVGDTVKWQAQHFGFNFKLEVTITEMEQPSYFVDEQIRGPFKYMSHRHSFESDGEYCFMKDEFEYSSPLGILGKIVDALFMKRYMTKLLQDRNHLIKASAEK
ncbi:SRPBCC family protein [bacterium]|nr:SRPBCC family protein [bacterium]